MLVSQIPYYAKFTFKCKNPQACYSTADKENLNFITDMVTKEPIDSIRIGDKLVFHTDENLDKKYVVKDIYIKDMVDDLRFLRYGIDSEDCTEMGGKDKTWLFSIFVIMDAIE